METLPDSESAAADILVIVSATDASHSAIGRTTAVDYNLSSIHRNGVIVVDEVVGMGPVLLVEPSADLLPCREAEQEVLDAIDAPPAR